MSGRPRRSRTLDLDDPRLPTYWSLRRLATLTTLRPDGTPHTVPVAPIVELSTGTPVVRILTSQTSRKVRNVRASPRVSLCEVEGRHWVTVEGLAHIRTDAAFVSAAEEAYAVRFRTPRPNADRVVLVIDVDSAMGSLP